MAAQYATCYVTSDIDMDSESYYSGYYFFVVDCTSSNITITLPTITGDGITFSFVRTDTTTNILYIDVQTTNTLNNGTAAKALPYNKSVEVISYGTNWIAPVMTVEY